MDNAVDLPHHPVPDPIPREPPRLVVILAFASVYVFWGSTYLGIHYVLEGGIPPFLGAGVRMAIAGSVLWLFVRMRGLAQPSLKQMGQLAVAGGLLFVGGNGLVVLSQQSLPSGLAATLIATTPFWMMGIERLLPGGERPSRMALVGVVIGFVGVALLIGPSLGMGGTQAAPFLTCLLAPIFWSLGALFAKHRLRGLPSLTVTAHEMVFASMLLLLVGWLRGESGAWAPQPVGWLALAYLVVFGSWLGFSAFVYLMAHVPAAKVATYCYVNPVVAVVLGWLVAGETLSACSLVATGITLGGVVLVNIGGLRNARTPS